MDSSRLGDYAAFGALLPPEFEGHPLRKDFVLASRVVKPWPGEKEPGGGREGPRKRAPKRPPGFPEGWGRAMLEVAVNSSRSSPRSWCCRSSRSGLETGLFVVLALR